MLQYQESINLHRVNKCITDVDTDSSQKLGGARNRRKLWNTSDQQDVVCNCTRTEQSCLSQKKRKIKILVSVIRSSTLLNLDKKPFLLKSYEIQT